MPRPLRIAAINEDPAMLTLLRDQLLRTHYEVRTLRTGIGNEEVLRTIAPDLILLDISPDDPESGWLVARRLAQDPAWATTPLILTVDDTADLAGRVAALRSLAVTVLRKPFTLPDLITLIERVAGAWMAGEGDEGGEGG